VNDLFTYNYPFSLPNFFQHKLKKHQLEVGLKFFQAFNSLSIEKTISVEEFFKLYPSVLENKKKTEIKKYFIQLVELLKEHNLIESYYKVFSNGNSYDVQELTIKNISEGFMFYERIQL
jgi:ribonucleotide reductase beta subunit family protein with ferritin-like domain